MSARPCSVCAVPALAKFVDASPDLSAAGLSRQAGGLGMDLSADRIITHRKHRADEGYTAPAKTKRDFAALVRERAVEQFEAGDLDLQNKDHVAGINAGLKAQTILDKRDASNKKHTQSDMLVALLSALRGETPRLPSPIAPPDAIDVTPHEAE